MKQNVSGFYLSLLSFSLIACSGVGNSGDSNNTLPKPTPTLSPSPEPSPTLTPTPEPSPGPTPQWTKITGLGIGPTLPYLYGRYSPTSMLAQDSNNGQFWIYKNSVWTQVTGLSGQPDCDWNSYSCNLYGADLSATKIILNFENAGVYTLWEYINGTWSQITDGTGASGTQPIHVNSFASNATVDSMFVVGDGILWKYTTLNGWQKITDGSGANAQPTIVNYVIGSPTDISMVIDGTNNYTFTYTTANGWEQINNGAGGTPPAPNQNTSYYGNSTPDSIVLTEGSSSFNLWTYIKTGGAGLWTNQNKVPRYIYGSPTPASILMSVGLAPLPGGSTIWTLIGTTWTQLTDGTTHSNTQPAYVEGNNYSSVATNAVPNLFFMIDSINVLWGYKNGVWTNFNAMTGAPSLTSKIFGDATPLSIIVADNQVPPQLWTYSSIGWTQITGGLNAPPSVAYEYGSSTNLSLSLIHI